MATTTPNFGWPVPTSTDLVKDGATAIEALGDGIDTSLVDLKGGTTGQVLSKATSADMDFTWVTSDDANAIQNAIVDAKGDLIAATANDTPARLAVGANNTVLIADSTQSTGLRWGGGWTTWSPGWINLTVGNGTIVARYQQIGKTVNFYLSFTFGSTSSMGTTPLFTLPVTSAQSFNQFFGFFTDVGVGNYNAAIDCNSTVAYLTTIRTSGTYADGVYVTPTIPFTWTTTDSFTFSGTYEAA
jgi:hypothetical protein